MPVTRKSMSQLDGHQTLQASFNDVDSSLTTAGFLTGKVGRKIVPTISTTSVANDTITYDYQESGTSLYQVRVIYTDATYATMVSAERIS